jgi:DNA polymerase-3 subunit epsilon
MRQIILDTETTGLDPSQGHRVIEIGCVELVNRSYTGNTLHLYLNPDRDSDPEALAVHGLTTEFLADKPRFPEVFEKLLAFVADAEIIIHNASFDTKFLNAELARVGKPELATCCSGITDSLLHARSLHPGKRNSLDALCDRYGISNAHRTLHGALLDSQLLGEVWLAMTRGQDALLIDVDDQTSTGADGLVLGRFDASVLAVMPASESELAEHDAYMVGLDKAAGGQSVWRKLEAASQDAAEAGTAAA